MSVNSTALRQTRSARDLVLLLARRVPFSGIAALTGCKTLVTLHHLVSSDDVPHVKHLYCYKDEGRFQNDVDEILKRYVPISAADLLRAISGGGDLPGKRQVLFTFDDGLRETHDTIAPILAAKGAPGLFFVITDCVDNKALMYRHKASVIVDALKYSRTSDASKNAILSLLSEAGVEVDRRSNLTDAILCIGYEKRTLLDRVAAVLEVDFNEYLRRHKPYVTSEQIRSLKKGGFSVGAHSLDHPPFEHISPEEQVRQTTDSLGFVKTNYGVEQSYFAFPYGDTGVGLGYFERIASAVDLTFGTRGFERSRTTWNVQRVSMDGKYTAKELLWLFTLLHLYDSIRN